MLRVLKVAAAALIATTAIAQADTFDRLILRLNGHITGVGAVVDQSTTGDLDEFVGAVDTGLLGSAVLPLDGGGEIGVRVALDLDYSTHVDTFLNDAGRSDILEEAWLYWEGRLGRVQMGLMDGAADVLGLTPPSVSSSIRVDNPEVYVLAFPCLEPACFSDTPGAPGSLFNPNGMQLRSDVHGSDNFLKIMYVTPVFDGFRFAVSYAPDGSRYLGDLFGGDDVNEQTDIVDVAASYTGTVGMLDIGASVGYVFANNANPQFTNNDDLEDFGAAIKLGYNEWTLGAAYRLTNVAGGGPVIQTPFTANVFEGEQTEAWSFGLMYETGPWAASVNYITMTEELSFAEQDGSGLQFALGYTINEAFRITGGYQRYEFERDFGGCGFGFGGCTDLDA
ncbi:MAG: porin, partial [Alphaproteobacteria bacterium]|nr:porin [Alphaproteobacteria bacterium]